MGGRQKQEASYIEVGERITREHIRISVSSGEADIPGIGGEGLYI